MGQDGARPGAAGRRRRRHAGPLRRGLRTDHRRQLRALSPGGRHRPMTSFRFAVNVTPKPGILDPAGRAVEGSLGHLGIDGVHDVRIGRRVELTVDAADEAAARAVVERLAGELLSNPLIEVYAIEPIGAASSAVGAGAGRADDAGPHRRRRLPGEQLRPRHGPCARPRRRRAGRPVARAGLARWRRRGRPAGRLRLRRLRPGRRHRAVQPGHARGRRLRGGRRARPRDLQRLPGPRRGRASSRARCCATRRSGSPARRSRSPPSGSTRRSPTRLDARRPLRMPVAHGEGRFYADDATLDALERDGQVLFRYVDAAAASPAGPDDAGQPRTARCGRSPGS